MLRTEIVMGISEFTIAQHSFSTNSLKIDYLEIISWDWKKNQAWTFTSY